MSNPLSPDLEPDAIQTTTTPTGITTITVNRPHRRNAIDGPTATKLTAAFIAFEANPTQKVAILYGANGTFCSGFDLHELATFKPNDPAYHGPNIHTSNDVDGTNHGPIGPTRMLIRKPVICAIAGYAVAGGLELSLIADLRIIETNTIFGVFNRRFGVPLIDGGTQRLPAIIGLSRALDMILTGRAVAAEEALQWGLANRVVAKGSALQEARKLAEVVAGFPQGSLRADRKAVYGAVFGGWEEGLGREWAGGVRVVAGEGVEGARRWVAGEGRHGDFGKGVGKVGL